MVLGECRVCSCLIGRCLIFTYRLEKWRIQEAARACRLAIFSSLIALARYVTFAFGYSLTEERQNSSKSASNERLVKWHFMVMEHYAQQTLELQAVPPAA